MGSVIARPAHVLAPEAIRARLMVATGFPDLDVLDLFQPARLTLLLAPPPETYYGIVASATRAGLTVVIDGGNRFDAFELVAHGARLGIHEDDVLGGVRVARAFTPYQMQALIEDTLPRLLDQGGLFVLVSGIADQYFDVDTPRREGRALYRRALRVLGSLARASGVPVVMSDHGAAQRQRDVGALAVEASDETAIFEPRPQGSYMVHLPRRGGAFLCRSAVATQSTLAEWTDPAVGI